EATTGQDTSGAGIYAWASTIFDCKVENNIGRTGSNQADSNGGGIYAYSSQIDRVAVKGNQLYGAQPSGAGAYIWLGSIKNTLIVGNEIYGDFSGKGGGAYLDGASMTHCTVVLNEMYTPTPYTHGVRATGSSTMNCIILFNGQNAIPGPHVNYNGKSGSSISSSCTAPLMTGAGNIDADPQFFDLAEGDLRVELTSPCIDAGAAGGNAPFDFYGTPRPTDGDNDGSALPDMGAIEYCPTCYELSLDTTGPGYVANNVPMDYVLTVSNAGPTDAIGVMLTDSLPDGVTFISSDGAYVQSNQDITFTIDHLAVGASTSITVTVQSPPAPGVITNHAVLHESPNDPYRTESAASSVTRVNLYDLSLTADGPTWVESNAVFTYTVSVSNSGPGLASGVVLDHEMSAATVLQSVSADYVEDNGSLLITLDDLVAGSSTEVVLTVVSPGNPGGIHYSVDLSAAGDTNDLNNSAAVITDVATFNAWLTMSGPSHVSTSAVYAYEIDVFNVGPGIARRIEVTDTLPPEATFISASPDCVFVNGEVICSTPELPAGGSISFVIEVQAPAVYAELLNEADMTMDPGDTTSRNNDDALLTICAAYETRYVDPNNPTPSPPYTSWATAANDIQTAIDASYHFDKVLVADGMYPITDPIQIRHGVTVTSVNGRDHSIIDGGYVTRCIVMDHANAAIEGFTIQRGSAPREFIPPDAFLMPGAGIRLNQGRVSDCRVINNLCDGDNEDICGFGAGIYGKSGTLVENTEVSDNLVRDCRISGGAGIYMLGGHIMNCEVERNTILNCGRTTKGGGIFIKGGVIEVATVRGNLAITGSASWMNGGGIFAEDSHIKRVLVADNEIGRLTTDAGSGGGIYLDGGILRNALIVNNRVYGLECIYGGGVMQVDGTVTHCTIAHNRIDGKRMLLGHGIRRLRGTVKSSIIYFNGIGASTTQTPESHANYSSWVDGQISYSCVVPLINNSDNIDFDPEFVDAAAGLYHLNAGSPCIDTAATDVGLPIDLPGTPRPLDGDGDGSFIPDMGAYEYFEPSDVSITKTGPDTVQTDTMMYYTLFVENTGPASTDIEVVDTLPPGVTYVSSSPDCVYQDGRVICSRENLNAGDYISFDVAVNAPTRPSVIENHAMVTSPTDIFLGNNEDSWTTDVGLYDASVAIAGPAWVSSNAPAIYTIVVEYPDLETDEDMVLSYTLPPSATFVSATPGYTENNGVYSYTLDDFSLGQV
ncbi:MAG: choice-of-anchor Q domain-containing protein, partial [Verrucomicrobiota bacterium]